MLKQVQQTRTRRHSSFWPQW